MPELPEVETTRRSLAPALDGRRIVRAVVRDRRLRWPIPADFEADVAGRRIVRVDRRAKYLLIVTDAGTLLGHLGMSGRMTVVPADRPPVAHDHVDLVLDDGHALRFHDPRRFGSLHWLAAEAPPHPLLAHLAPEPFDPVFDGAYLYRITRGRSAAIKHVLMNASLVTGVGNIYASEALFRARIRPTTAARRLSRARCDALVDAVRETLARAIAAGGTTLRDYVDGHGDPGAFQTETAVYDRAGAPCVRCDGTVRRIVQGQRATYWCPGCQH
ncbi:MAG: bifunctional DNA-formamidopyrimidine glycosylase/DNA-(apurinic or apyrimidinic site) lyase [Burkholderiales bacterium]|nr:bifunctional DNA-formamidopyrimidine glycosylase/DNA-(apurinic or apyrimidinic site) lyase [Burkholderiales bacterium]